MGRFLDSPQSLLFEVRERVARITLNRPDKRNTLSPQVLEELHAALLEADARQDVNVVVLAGAGKDFCAGYDLVGAYAGRAATPSRSSTARSPAPSTTTAGSSSVRSGSR